MLDRFREVVVAPLGAARRAPPCPACSPTTPRRPCRARGALRGSSARFSAPASAAAIASWHLVLPQVQAGELAPGCRRRSDRAPSRACTRRSRPSRPRRPRSGAPSRNCAYASAILSGAAGEPPRPLSARRRLRCAARASAASSIETPNAATRTASFIPELFHKSAKVSYIRRMAGRPGTARDSRVSQLQNAGDARQERRGAQVRDLQARVSDQGRHSGHADRRSHDRGRIGTGASGIDDREFLPRPPAADRRRRLHHAGHSRAARSAFPTRTSPISSSRPPRRSSRGNPHLNRGDRRAARPRPARADRRPRARRGGCAPSATISRSIFTAGRARRC